MTRILGIKHGMARESFETVTKVRELRKKNGWSVKRISEHMGISYHTVESWVYNKTRVGA